MFPSYTTSVTPPRSIGNQGVSSDRTPDSFMDMSRTLSTIPPSRASIGQWAPEVIEHPFRSHFSPQAPAAQFSSHPWIPPEQTAFQEITVEYVLASGIIGFKGQFYDRDKFGTFIADKKAYTPDRNGVYQIDNQLFFYPVDLLRQVHPKAHPYLRQTIPMTQGIFTETFKTTFTEAESKQLFFTNGTFFHHQDSSGIRWYRGEYTGGGRPHGIGTLATVDGRVYVGTWEGTKDGSTCDGFQILPEGTVTNGKFKFFT